MQGQVKTSGPLRLLFKVFLCALPCRTVLAHLPDRILKKHAFMALYAVLSETGEKTRLAVNKPKMPKHWVLWDADVTCRGDG